MAKEDFENCLRQYLERRPFRPFVIEFTDGRRLVIKQIPVVFNDGAAGFIDPSDTLVEFFHDEVQAFALWEEEVPA